MKIFTLAPRENWICDRIAQEWYEYFPQNSVHKPENADIVWLQAGWCWNHIDQEILKNKKVICTEHHIVPSKFTKHSLLEFKYRDQFVDAYHVPNVHTEHIVKQLTSKPIVVLNYWYDSKKWYPGNKHESKLEMGFSESSFIIGSFQRDSEGDTSKPKLEKGPDLFCDYVEKINNIKDVHVLLGGWRRKYVIDRLKKNNIPYTMMELTPLKTLRKMYLASDLYVVASRQEGGPQALLEGPATLTPIITTDMGVARQTIAQSCIIDIKKDLYFPSEEDIKFNYNNVKKYRIEKHGIKYMNYFKEVLENV